MTPEPTFTLAEARREFARQECAAYGHDLDFVLRSALLRAEPVRAICSRCGRMWTMTEVTG